MKRLYIFSLFLSIALVSLMENPAFSAIGADSMSEIFETVTVKSVSWRIEISRYALYILWFTGSISFVIGYKDLIVGGGVTAEGIISLVVRQFLILGIITWLVRNSVILLWIPRSLTELGVKIGGKDPTLHGAEQAFNSLINPLQIYYSSFTWIGAPGEKFVCIIIILFIWALMVLFATTVLLVQLETIFILIGGMITASFFVLGYFRDIFMGYIKALFMNGLKLFLLALILGLFLNIMDGWGVTLANGFHVPRGRTTKDWNAPSGPGTVALPPAPEQQSALYALAIPMAFGLMGFYIIIKSVPQYAVAIMTGHATADGGLARAAVMAGVGTAATVWNISRGVSQIAINTAKATHSAANAFGNQVVSVGVNKDGKDLGTTKGAVLGALSAVKAFAAYPLNGQGKSSGERGYALSSASNNTGGNEMKAGSAIFNDAQKAARMYHSE